MARRKKLSSRDARHDAAYRKAKNEDFAARAIYKLEELDKKFRLFKPGHRVLDLGCWPGSWMQYTAERVTSTGLVIGVDLRAVDIALPGWTETLVADVEQLDPATLLEGCDAFDVVVSDMAPHTIGDRGTDQWRSEELVLRALDLAQSVLRPGGHFAGKVFQGGRFPELLARVRGEYQQAKAFRTSATRAGSSEQYLVGRGRRK